MPPEALCIYLESKFRHEMINNNYFADMLRMAAAVNVKEPDKLPRLFDLLNKEQKQIESADEIPEDYDVDDVIAMFGGKGKLAKYAKNKK